MQTTNAFLILLFWTKLISCDDGERVESRGGKDMIHIIHGTKGGNRVDRIVLPAIPYNPYVLFNYPDPGWKASAILTPDRPDGNIKGMVIFNQWSPHNYIRITINATGVPPGRHAVHIHAFGDLSIGCKSTGPHVQNNFIGNVEASGEGTVSVTFFSAFLTMFGFTGIVGRSVVIHAKPIEVKVEPDAFSAQVQISPANALSFTTEETAVGPPIACGIITITDNLI